MAQVKIFKKISHYEKDGEQRTATNFYIQCGDMLIPVEVTYFPDKNTNKDNMYVARKTVLSTYAEVLPAREKDKSAETTEPENKPTLEAIGEDDVSLPY